MKCAQQGKRLIVKMKDLSTETMEPLRKADFKKGASLLAEYKGKSYPVLFESFAGKHRVLVWPLRIRSPSFWS